MLLQEKSLTGQHLHPLRLWHLLRMGIGHVLLLHRRGRLRWLLLWGIGKQRRYCALLRLHRHSVHRIVRLLDLLRCYRQLILWLLWQLLLFLLVVPLDLPLLLLLLLYLDTLLASLALD